MALGLGPACKRKTPSGVRQGANSNSDQGLALNSTAAGSWLDSGLAAADSGRRETTIGLRRRSCSLALMALSRSWNQVFSGQFQF